jgi:VanZ family protein
MLKSGRPFEASPPDAARPSPTIETRLRGLAAVYAALLVHLSLYPYSGWRSPSATVWAYWLSPAILPLPHFFPVDAILNFIAYIPLGGFALWSQPRGWRRFGWASAGAWLACTALSLSLELTQGFLPSRVSSKVDLLLNSLGAAVGVVLTARANRLLTERSRISCPPQTG